MDFWIELALLELISGVSKVQVNYFLCFEPHIKFEFIEDALVGEVSGLRQISSLYRGCETSGIPGSHHAHHFPVIIVN